MKRNLLILALIFLINPVMATDLENLNEPKSPAYRVGTSDDIEKEYKVKNSVKTQNVKHNKDFEEMEEGLTYADLSIKKISLEIAQSLNMEYNDLMEDLSLLWQGAATKSDTIKYALYKLSNPDADKPDEKSVKKVLTTIANMSTLVGASTANPLISTGSMFTGSLLNIMGQDAKAMNYKFTRVNDADMIILVRKIEDLQQNIVNQYCDYMCARKVLNRTTKMVKQRENNYELAQKGEASKELIIISDAYYRDALDMQMKARDEFFAKRSTLKQLVGDDIFGQFEQLLEKRDKEN